MSAFRLSSLAASVLFASTSLIGTSAQAQAQPAAAPASPHTITGNIGLVSDYRFRGISQTYKGPAIQGGVDYSHASGFYLGTWASNVSGNQYPGGASMEWDFYGGYKFEVAKDLTLDVGALYYYYPGASYGWIASNSVTSGTGTKFNNTEIYIGASYKWLSVKYSHTLSDYFGVKTNTFGNACENANTGGNASNCFAANPGGSKGSGYIDFSAAIPLADKWTLNAHVGHQSVRHYSKLNYTDWKLGVTYDLNGWMLGAAYVDTNAKSGWWYGCKNQDAAGSCKKTGNGTAVLSVTKSF